MFPFALLFAAVIHDPAPSDIHRFGFDVRPIGESIPRRVWNESRHRASDLRRPISGYLLYGRERELADAIAAADWTERVWDAVDDMGRECCSPECRMYAAKRLRERLGPVAYYLGELPTVGR